MKNKIIEVSRKIYLSKWFIFLIIIIGTAARLRQYLFNRSLWSDEAALALNIIRYDYLDLLKPLDYSQAGPPLFLIITNFFTNLFGDNEYVLRLLPLIASIFSLFLFWYLTRKFLNKYIVPIAVGLLTFSGTAIYYSDELKQYSSDLMVTIIVLILALHVYEKEFDLKSNLFFGFGGAFLVWLSHPSVFVLSGTTLSLLLSLFLKEKSKGLKKFVNLIFSSLIWGTSFVVGYLTIVKASAHQGFYGFWYSSFAPMPIRTINDLLWYSETIFATIRIPISIYFPGIVMVMMFAGFVGFYNKKNKLFFLLVLFPLIILLSASMLKLYPLHSRFLLFALPIFYLIIARGVEEFSYNINKKNVIIIIFLVLLLLAQPLFSSGRSLIQPKFRAETRPLIEHIQRNMLEGDKVYVYYATQAPFQYYVKDFEIDYVIGVESRGDPNKYLEELDNLDLQGRIWFIFSQAYGDEQSIYIERLEEMGKRLEHMNAFGADLYLYDIYPMAI